VLDLFCDDNPDADECRWVGVLAAQQSRPEGGGTGCLVGRRASACPERTRGGMASCTPSPTHPHPRAHTIRRHPAHAQTTFSTHTAALCPSA
jgi:hypothetical protein